MSYTDALTFTFNGVNSSEFGIFQATLSTGNKQEVVVPSREIITEEIYGREKSYFYGYQYQPLTLPVTFYIEDYNNINKMNRIFRWLFQTDFKPLVFSNNANKVYYAMIEDESSIEHNSINKGLITVKFKCNSPFAYSPTQNKTEIYSNNTSGQILEIQNNGIMDTYLHITIIKDTLGDIQINNLTNGMSFKLVNTLANEHVEIDSENEIIDTSLPLTYRYKDYSGDFIKLAVGKNRLQIIGNGEFKFRHADILI